MTVQVSDFDLINTLNDNASLHVKDIDGFDRRMLASTFRDKILEPLADSNSTVLVGAVKAAILGSLAPMQSIRVVDPDNLLDSDVDHTAILQAAIDLSSTMGVQINLHPQIYNYSTLELKSGMAFYGSGTDKCFLVCSSTAGALDPVLWSIKKADDGTRCRNIRLENIYIGKAISGVAAAQDANPKLGGLCLAACENSVLNNLSFGGFGQGGIVFARAQAGDEGLGFLNTTQDGNYNTGNGLFFASCGKYNEINAAMWFKFGANSNKFYGVFGKGISGAATIGISSGNDNVFIGGTAETALSIARLIPSTVELFASSNIFIGFRAEGVSGDAYYLEGGNNTISNIIMGGLLTSVGGELVNKTAAPNNFVVLNGYYDSPPTNSNQVFPPSTNVTINHNLGMQRFNSVRADDSNPLYKITEGYNESFVREVAYNSLTATEAGTVLWSSEIYCNDASTGGKGINAKIQARTTDTAGRTAIYIMAGRESDGLEDTLKVSATEVEIIGFNRSLIMSSPDGTRYKLTPPNGGGAATWVAV